MSVSATLRGRAWVRVGLPLLLSALVLAGGAFWLARNLSPASVDCRVDVPHSQVDPMVFPTKEGSAALDAAIIDNAEPETIVRVIRKQGGFSVPRGTSCSALERGALYSRVLLTDGPVAGRTVWLPALHVHGG